MKYVLDSCVAFKWLVPEVGTPKALQIRDDFSKATVELLAPDVFPAETTHALTRAERQKRITPAQGALLLKDLLKYLPQLHSSLLLLPRAYEISSAMRVGVYDCLYVALAERESCDFITADDKLVKNLQAQFPFIKELFSRNPSHPGP
jgi:predicted nucleic acid-binding protein